MNEIDLITLFVKMEKRDCLPKEKKSDLEVNHSPLTNQTYK